MLLLMFLTENTGTLSHIISRSLIHFAHVRHLPHLLLYLLSLTSVPLPSLFIPQAPPPFYFETEMVCFVNSNCFMHQFSLLFSCFHVISALTVMPRSVSLHTGGVGSLWQEQSVFMQPGMLAV